MFQQAQQNTQVFWQGASGRSYTTYLHPIGTRYRPIAGVYIACHQRSDGRWVADYIGEAQNLDDRVGAGLQRHHKLERMRRAGATHLCTLAVSGGSTERLGIERDLRHSCRPSCNDQ